MRTPPDPSTRNRSLRAGRATLPFGAWKSPLSAPRVTSGTLRFDHLVLDGQDVYWAEGRASQGGRSVVVRRTPDGEIADVTPADFNVRTRVHEYGGSAYTVHRGVAYFSNFADQRVYCLGSGGAPRPITREQCFYADASIDARRERLLLVREDHTNGDHEPLNTIVAVSFDGAREDLIVTGADFYSDPIISPDGQQFAWLEWRHPNMPWDGTELWVAPVNPDGSLGEPRKVAGGRAESIFQPEWSPDGRLYYTSDRTGFWNLYREGELVYQREADFGKAQWIFSQNSYAFIDRSRIAASYTEDGRWKLAFIDAATGRFDPIDLPLEPTDGVRASAEAVYFIGGSPTDARSVVRLPLDTLTLEVMRAATTDRVDRAWISVPEAITFQSNGQAVHAFYYPPTNPEIAAPPGDKPPLLVLSHGGPTDQATDVFEARTQFWTSRGFAVVDVNYGGSSGFGRAYRERLNGTWGIVDVEDCVNAAKYLVDTGRADANRLCIRGGSAGGYTTLAALTFHDVFKAGASYYGISDIEVLAHDTHKFESRYCDTLIGPYPAAKQKYVERSPIHFTDRLSSALILFQGLEDKVVPPNQSEMMADAVRRKGLPVAYVAYPGEQHGFRKAENIVRSLEAELYFYAAVFGITLADTIEPVQIDNLRR
jgi:dipeptidyl aminopeptidase/acylaminoacyl peptidase